jgi:hypothetical protein
MAGPPEVPPTKAHIPYTITSQDKTETLTPDGRFVKVWRVTYEAPNGTHTFIEVPESEFTPANVDALIEAELDTIMGVHELGATPHPDNAA